MITVVQRVSRAAVIVGSQTVGEIGEGLVLLVGIERGDTAADASATARKVANLRIFPGRAPMDRSVVEVAGSCLVVSQFTLAAALRRGNRPSFTGAEDPAVAEARYLEVAEALRQHGITAATGAFGAHMEVDLVNSGPATFLVITRNGAVRDLDSR